MPVNTTQDTLDSSHLDQVFASAKDVISQGKDQAQDLVKKGRQTLSTSSAQVIEEAKALGTKVGTQIKDRPYLYALGAVGLVGAGFLLAKVIAKTASSLSSADMGSTRSSKGWSRDHSGLTREPSASAKDWSTESDSGLTTSDSLPSDSRADFH